MSGFTLLLTCLLLGVGLLLLRAAELRHDRLHLLAFDLRFPRDLEAAHVQSFLTAVTGLLPPVWLRWMRTPFIGIEVHASSAGVTHRLLVPRRYRRSIEAALAAHLPTVDYSAVEDVAHPALTAGVEYRLSNAARLLTIDPVLQSAQLLAALQPLAKNETVVVQCLVAPARPVSPVRLANARERQHEVTLNEGVLLSSEAVTAAKKKRARPLVVATMRIGVAAQTPARRRALLRDVSAAWVGARAPGTRLNRRVLPSELVVRRIQARTVPLNSWPTLLSVDELAALIGFPIATPHLEGVSLSGCPPMAVPPAVPRTGTIIGTGTHPRTRRPVALDANSRSHHLAVTGATGSGKSVLAAHLAVHDAEHGAALIVIDPKDGGLVSAITESLPEHRLNDVIVLDPSDNRPVGFDPLHATVETRELVVDRVLGLMVDIWGTNVGPRSADILRNALLLAATHPNLRVTEVPQLIIDPSFRRRALASCSPSPELAAWWAWADGLSAPEWSAMTQAPLNKLRSLLRPAIADVLGQDTPAVDFDRVLRERQILLVRLPVGQLGEEATSILGVLILNQAWQAVAARAALPPSKRRPASIVVDEAGSVLRYPGGTIETFLTQCRAYNTSITLLAQHLGLLPRSVLNATLANARTKVVLACGRDDAGVLARELGHDLTVEALMGMEAFHGIAAVHAEGRTQAPATVRLTPPGVPLRSASEVFERSRERFGADRDEVRRVRQQRLEAPRAATGEAVGRKRRASS